jgi:hypothetical protein
LVATSVAKLKYTKGNAMSDEEIYMLELSKLLFAEGKSTAAGWCKRAADKIAEMRKKVEELESHGQLSIEMRTNDEPRMTGTNTKDTARLGCSLW